MGIGVRWISLGALRKEFYLLNPEDVDHINNFEIEPLSEFSDHCSITFSFINKLVNTENKDKNNINNEQYVKFDESKVDNFISLLGQKHNEFQTCIKNIETITDINDIANDFITVWKIALYAYWVKHELQKITIKQIMIKKTLVQCWLLQRKKAV